MFTTSAKNRNSLSFANNNLFKAHNKKVNYVIFSAMPEELEFLQNNFSHCKSETIKIRDFIFTIYDYNGKSVLLGHTGLGTTFAASIITLVFHHLNPTHIFFFRYSGCN